MLNLDDLKKLSEAEVKTLKDGKKIDLSVYCDWLEWSKAEAVTASRPKRTFSIKATDKGQIQVQPSHEQFPKCFDVESLVELLDNGQAALKFIAEHGERLKTARIAHRKSDDYKAACEARRKAFEASKKTST